MRDLWGAIVFHCRAWRKLELVLSSYLPELREGRKDEDFTISQLSERKQRQN